MISSALDNSPLQQQLKIEGITPLAPPLWARSGHTQTIWGHMIPSPMYQGALEEVTIPLADGEKLKAYLKAGRHPIIVSMFHGLSGDITADYMQRTAILCDQLGLGFLLVNHRGTHTGMMLSKTIYHSGRGEDISDVTIWLRDRFPNHQQIAVGVSMSGSILLNLLTGRRGTHKPDAAITVNAPLDLLAGALKLRTGINRIYDFRFVRRIEKDFNYRHQLGLLPKLEIPMWAGIYEFDQMFTGPMTEFGDRETYYRECSTTDHLHKIDRPTIMLSTMDDPFINSETYFTAHAKAQNPHIRMHLEDHGGHLGYLAGSPTVLGSNRWLDYFLKEAFTRLASVDLTAAESDSASVSTSTSESLPGSTSKSLATPAHVSATKPASAQTQPFSMN